MVRLINWPEAPAGGDAADYAGDVDVLLEGAEFVLEAQAEPLGDILDDLLDAMNCFFVISKDGAAACVLFVAFSHVFQLFDLVPYLFIRSPAKRCGKSRLIEALIFACHGGRIWANTSIAGLFRSLDSKPGTLGLDEADQYLKMKENRDLAGLLNAGYSRVTAKVVRVIETKEGLQDKEFNCFGPKIIGGIKDCLPDTTMDRSVIIDMARKAKDEKRQRPRTKALKRAFEPIRERLEEWADIADIEDRDREDLLPTGLDDRAEDLWEGLLIVAEAAGPEWLARAQKAATDLSRGRDATSDDELTTLLLRDVNNILKDVKDGFMKSSDLVVALRKMEDRAWATLGKEGKGLTQVGLARWLKDYHVVPDRASREVVPGRARGYDFDSVAEVAWRFAGVEKPQERATPPKPQSESSHPSQDGNMESDKDLAWDDSKNEEVVPERVVPAQPVEESATFGAGTGGTTQDAEKPKGPDCPPGYVEVVWE